MQMKHISRLAILSFLTGTALGKYCYESGQKWIDVGTEPVISEAIDRVCSTKRLAGDYPQHETIRTCENVAGHSFYVSIQHLDSEGGLDPWLLSPGTCRDLIKKVSRVHLRVSLVW